MKNIIVILFSMMLGVYIFTSTLSGSGSLKSRSGNVMETQVNMLKSQP